MITICRKFIVLGLVLMVSPSFAQTGNVDYSKISSDEVEWSEGTITLTNGQKLEGLLKYNSKNGLLGFESGSQSKSFTARTVIGFEFFDAILNEKRSFISVEYGDLKDKNTLEQALREKKDDTTPWKKYPQFFEILTELPAFAVLSTMGNVQIKEWTPTTGGIDNPGTHTMTPFKTGPTTTTYSQTEVLFIFDTDGNIEPLIEVTNKENDSFFDTKSTRRKTLNGDLLEKYTSPYYRNLVEYAKTNKLKFKRKEDLLEILEYYKTLIAE